MDTTITAEQAKLIAKEAQKTIPEQILKNISIRIKEQALKGLFNILIETPNVLYREQVLEHLKSQGYKLTIGTTVITIDWS